MTEFNELLTDPKDFEIQKKLVEFPVEPCCTSAVHTGSKYSTFSNPDDERFNKPERKYVYWGRNIGAGST